MSKAADAIAFVLANLLAIGFLGGIVVFFYTIFEALQALI